MIVWTDPEEVEISVTLYKDAREGSPFEDKLWTFVIEDVNELHRGNFDGHLLFFTYVLL